jgi:hypothetical protein
MTAVVREAKLDFTRPCPICDRHLDLSSVEMVPWGPRTLGERLVFRCAKCGVVRTEWNALPVVDGPEVVPEPGPRWAPPNGVLGDLSFVLAYQFCRAPDA